MRPTPETVLQSGDEPVSGGHGAVRARSCATWRCLAATARIWFSLNRLALGGATLWALGAGDRLTRIDTAGVKAPAQVPGVNASAVAASGDGAWALTRTQRSYVLLRISGTGRVMQRVPLVATDLDGMAAGAGAVWVTAPQDGLLWRVTPDAHVRSTSAQARAVSRWPPERSGSPTLRAEP